MRNPVYLISPLLFMLSFSVYSQGKVSGSVAGKILDTAGKQNLAGASIIVKHTLDSSIQDFSVADKNGAFLIKSLPGGNYRLIISFQGYQAVVRRFSISATDKNVDFGTLYMLRKSDLLDEVIVEQPPMSVKKDTVEYNAAMFTTKPNALAEDLLKKLPGVQVDKSGNITAQGETVTRVLVNGQRFFNDDPKLATRNLPPDIIDKIQVFDDLSDQSKFTGFDDGNRVKTINIITKKDKRQGYFGRVVAGIGTDQNYDESINMHRFNNDQQISLLGQANDINKQNFTIQDILGNSGGRRGGSGNFSGATNQSSPGITTVWAGGANFRDTWDSAKTNFYGSYFFNSQHVSTNQQDTVYKFITADSSNYSGGNQSNIQKTENHRIYLNLEQKFDSSNSLIFRPNITFQTTTPRSSSNSSTTDNDFQPVSTSISNASSSNSGFNINSSNLQFRHKFNKQFRTISLDLNTTANVNDGYGYSYAINDFYKLGKVDTINQYYNDSLHTVTFSPTLSYTEPVGKNQILELNYNYTYSHSTTINNTYDYVDSLNTYSSFDSLFSNSYKFTSKANRISLNYRIQNPKYNLSIGSGLQFTDFYSLNTTKNILVSQDYVNLTPTVNFQYQFSKTQHFRLNYSGRTGNPTPSQLQPLTTTSDNINFQVGNPELKPQFTHSLRMLYASFDPATQRVLFATINASTIVNDIQTSVTYNAKGGQTTTYVNLNGTYNVSGYFNYGFALKKPKSNLNFISNINYSQSQTLVDTSAFLGPKDIYEHSFTRNTTLGETISLTTNLRKNFDMNFSSTSTYNIASNSIKPSQDLDYFSQIFSLDLTAYSNSGWLIATTFDYTYTNTKVPGYTASVPLLSPSIAKQLFKKKNGEIRLSVFDLLNQNTAVNKSVSTVQSTTTRTNTLTRYAMLTFTWNLNNFANQQQKRMPGMFNMYPRGGYRGGGNRQ
jgi:Outer membrane protein beta-barrel family/CarboxypepD_reg-like domain